MEILDLSGSWSYRTDYEDCGIDKEFFKDTFVSENFTLPGSACDNHLGKKQAYAQNLTKASVRAPREKYEYIAPLWLQKEVIFLYGKKISIQSKAMATIQAFSCSRTEMKIWEILSC